MPPPKFSAALDFNNTFLNVGNEEALYTAPPLTEAVLVENVMLERVPDEDEL